MKYEGPSQFKFIRPVLACTKNERYTVVSLQRPLQFYSTNVLICKGHTNSGNRLHGSHLVYRLTAHWQQCI